MRDFQANQARKDRFLIFWIEKNKFQTRKVKFQKRSKKSNFTKRLVHGFCQKIEILTMRAFQANQCRKDSFLIFWIEKKKIQTRKVKFQKGPKNQIFQRGQSMVVVKKLSFLPCGFFRQTKAEMIVSKYSGQKRILLRPEK